MNGLNRCHDFIEQQILYSVTCCLFNRINFQNFTRSNYGFGLFGNVSDKLLLVETDVDIELLVVGKM